MYGYFFLCDNIFKKTSFLKCKITIVDFIYLKSIDNSIKLPLAPKAPLLQDPGTTLLTSSVHLAGDGDVSRSLGAHYIKFINTFKRGLSRCVCACVWVIRFGLA